MSTLLVLIKNFISIFNPRKICGHHFFVPKNVKGRCYKD